MKYIIPLLFTININAIGIIDELFYLKNLEEYQECHDQKYYTEFCQKALDKWIKKRPEDTFKAAKLVRKNMNSHVSIKYFHMAKDLKDFNCNDEDLFIALKSAYKLPSSAKEKLERAQDLVFKKCGDSLPKKLVSELQASSSSFSLLCTDYLQAGLLKGLKARKCK